MKTKKEVVFAVRIDPDLRDAFIAFAQGQDRTASQLIRDFMREYVKKHGQRELFTK